MAKSFGKYAIISPVSYQLQQEPEWTWTFRPPTSGEELEMQKFMVSGRVQISEGITREYPPTTFEIAHRELALTFGGTTITLEGETEPILKEDARVPEVEAMLRQMPHALVMELWDALGEIVPTWGPVSPKKAPVSSGS
jgi:hypothetical protein